MESTDLFCCPLFDFMNISGFIDNTPGATVGGSPAMSGRSIASPHRGMVLPPLAKSMFSSPGLSLALQPNIDNNGEVIRAGETFEVSENRRTREEEPESRSGSDNAEGISGDDQDAADRPLKKKKPYHRHTAQQIQELES